MSRVIMQLRRPHELVSQPSPNEVQPCKGKVLAHYNSIVSVSIIGLWPILAKSELRPGANGSPHGTTGIFWDRRNLDAILIACLRYR
jgi:hypothetical protein